MTFASPRGTALVRLCLLASVAALVGALLPGAGTASAAAPDQPPRLIIVSGNAGASAKAVRVTAGSVEWLRESPEPGRGTMSPAELARHWNDYGFDTRHPRATISGDDVDVEVQLTKPPVVNDETTTFSIATLADKTPIGRLGPVSIFIEAQPPSLLYLQEAQGGTFEPAADGRSATLTLKSVSPRTFYFSDRPDRTSGSLATGDFAQLETLFSPHDPPNAAVVLSDPESDEGDVVIVTLAKPRFDATAGSFTYDTTLVDDVSDGLRNWAQRRDRALPPTFDHLSLYIDSTQNTDCPGQVSWDNGTVVVTATNDTTHQPLVGAEVKLFATSDPVESDYSGTTDASGKLTLSVLPTDAYIQDYYRTTITQAGYVTLGEQITVCPRQVVPITADLDPQ